jgi:rhodanese-related sulfurtransferase
MVDTVSKDELKQKIAEGSVVVVNVLSKDSYDQEHIKGSISIPIEELEKDGWKKLDKNKQIVTYCASYTCPASKRGAEFLKGKSFNVSAYEGGIKEWSESGYQTEGTKGK